MSGYILCHEKKAARPYYIEAVGIRIGTIEELCYYVSSYVWLLDSGFFCEDPVSYTHLDVYKRQEYNRIA